MPAWPRTHIKLHILPRVDVSNIWADLECLESSCCVAMYALARFKFQVREPQKCPMPGHLKFVFVKTRRNGKAVWCVVGPLTRWRKRGCPFRWTGLHALSQQVPTRNWNNAGVKKVSCFTHDAFYQDNFTMQGSGRQHITGSSVDGPFFHAV